MKEAENTVEFQPGRWSTFLTNGLGLKSKNRVACSTPNKSGTHSGKNSDLQWSSSPVLKNERLGILPKSSNLNVLVLCSDSPAERKENQPHVQKNIQSRHSSLRRIDFEMDSSDNELILPRSKTKSKLPEDVKKTKLIKSSEEIVDKNVIKQDKNKYCKPTMNKVDTVSATAKGDASNICFEMDSSDDEICLPRSKTKRKSPADVKKTKLIKSNEEILDKRLDKNTIKQDENNYSTMNKVNTFSASPKGDKSNIFFDVVSSDEDLISSAKKKLVPVSKSKKSDKERNLIQSKFREKETGSVMKHTKRAAMKEINEKSVSHNSQLSLSKPLLHGNEKGRSTEDREVAAPQASTSILNRAKNSRDVKSPKSNTLEVVLEGSPNKEDKLLSKRVSFSLPKKHKSPLNLSTIKTKIGMKKDSRKHKLINSTPILLENQIEVRRSSRPRATPTAYWLGERAVFEDAGNSPSTNDQEDYTEVPLKIRKKQVKEITKKCNKKILENKKKSHLITVTENLSSSITQTDCSLGIGIEDVDFCLDEEGESNGYFSARSLCVYSMESGFIKLLAGGRTGNLISTEHNQFYTVLENTVSLSIDGITKEFGRYDQFHVNKDVAHKILNKSSTLTSLLQHVILH